MARVVTIEAPRQVVIEDEPDRPLDPGDVRVETLYSGVSAGTELTAYRGSNPYVHKRWDPERRLFVEGEATFAYPLRAWGYEESGRVIEVGEAVLDAWPQLRPGARVFGTWGHRERAVLPARDLAGKVLRDDLPTLAGIFSHIGPIALNGVLDAGIRIGETVAVFGLGVPGQIVARLAKASGARVVGVDLIASRLAAAESAGAIDLAVDASRTPAGEAIKAFTHGRGADVAIEVSGSSRAIHEAIRSVARQARVVALGFVQGDAVGLRLGEEFHHNRIALVCSQIGDVAPELSARWDRARLIATIMELQADGTLDLPALVSHVLPFGQAAEAFRILDEGAEDALQIVLATDAATDEAADEPPQRTNGGER